MKYLFIIVFVIYLSSSKGNSQDDEEEFVPTKEWKVIKKGQKVPHGLHYRINLKTGLTEAKLLDEEIPRHEKTDLLQISQEESNEYSLDALKEALEHILGDDGDTKDKTEPHFRSYEELKEELGDLSLTSKVDAEIIKELIERHINEYKEGNFNENNVLNILEDFSYLTHQIDNGLEFVNQNGFRDIIYKNLNQTSDRIRESTLRLFGSLVQNNARVQIHALETGGLHALMRIISSDKQSEDVKSTAVFALGCFLRRFPLAQQKFVENGGVFATIQLFEKSQLKLQVKIVTLMSDLMLERKEAVDKNNQVLINQYKVVNLKEQLLGHDWCALINKLLTDIVNKNPDDHDFIEKVLVGIQIVSVDCKYSNKEILLNLRNKYELLAKSEGTDVDNYYKELYMLCYDLLKDKIIKTEL